jgi:hypothetical protein
LLAEEDYEKIVEEYPELAYEDRILDLICGYLQEESGENV